MVSALQRDTSLFIDTCPRKLAFLEYLDCLRRTDVFTCHTEYTVLFSYHESLFVRCRMVRRFKPFEYINRASFNTCSVCNADVKVIAYVLIPYPQLSWWVNWPPYFHSLIGASYLSFFFELGINWAFYFAVACSCAAERYRGLTNTATSTSSASCCRCWCRGCCWSWNSSCWRGSSSSCGWWCFGRSRRGSSGRLGRSYLRSHCLLPF